MNPRDLLASLGAFVREGEANVPSPCVAVCRMDPLTQQCEGCLRTIPEIAGWSRMDDAGKRVIWRHIEERMAGP